jgi:hypothetical protein
MNCRRLTATCALGWASLGGLPAALAAAEAPDALGPSVLHLPVLEQQADRGILTPLPIQLELPAGLPASRVLVHYKIFGSKQWTTLELRRLGRRWSGAIPCLEVSTITGDVSYYIRVHDAEGVVVAFSGSRFQPYRVRIVYTASPDYDAAESLTRDAAESLTRDESRERCPDPSDCPPGLPGCPSEKVERIPCKRDRDCEGGLSCGWDGYCEEDERTYNWLTLEAEAGVGLVSATGACSVPSQENAGYLCFRQEDGVTYTGNPLYTNERVALGGAPFRALLGFERLIHYSTSLGLRLGYAFAGAGPTAQGGSPFVPYSAELRASHFFGEDPFTSEKLLPYVLLSGGYGMFDVHTEVRVREDVTGRAFQGGNALEQTLDVWKRSGDAYAALGSGLFLRLSPKLGVSAELRLVETFPFAATLLLASLGVRAGL